ncbi:MAG: hypothetical protein M0Z31_06415 [Clostridia bacterium]|nr:hypothetical protein [Clostridia bacterium]
MKRILLLVCLSFLLMGCGIGSPTKINATKPKTPEMPPPYKLAKEDIIGNRWDAAINKLDITIKDFPSGEYAYKSRILKSIVFMAKEKAYDSESWAYINGAKAALLDEDKKRLLEKAKNSQKQWAKYAYLLDSEMKLIIKNYDNQKVSFDLNKYNILPSDEVYRKYDWLSRFGTAEDYEMEQVLSDYINNSFGSHLLYSMGYDKETLKDVLVKGEINYPAYFYLTGKRLYRYDSKTEPTGKSLLKKVLELTQNDKYNRNRLETESLLKDK